MQLNIINIPKGRSVLLSGALLLFWFLNEISYLLCKTIESWVSSSGMVNSTSPI